MDAALPEVVGVDKDACVNCQACISACPVEFCNDGSGEHIKINHDLHLKVQTSSKQGMQEVATSTQDIALST